MDAVPTDHARTPAIPLACNLLAIDPAHRLTHVTAGSTMFQTMVQESHELPDGLAFRFAADAYATVTAFIAQERHCCPFFHFQLDVSPDYGPLWLRITGPDGLKRSWRRVWRGCLPQPIPHLNTRMVAWTCHVQATMVPAHVGCTGR